MRIMTFIGCVFRLHILWIIHPMYVKGNIFAVPMFTPNLSGINFLLDFLVPISQTYNEKKERGLEFAVQSVTMDQSRLNNCWEIIHRCYDKTKTITAKEWDGVGPLKMHHQSLCSWSNDSLTMLIARIKLNHAVLWGSFLCRLN